MLAIVKLTTEDSIPTKWENMSTQRIINRLLEETKTWHSI